MLGFDSGFRYFGHNVSLLQLNEVGDDGGATVPRLYRSLILEFQAASLVRGRYRLARQFAESGIFGGVPRLNSGWRQRRGALCNDETARRTVGDDGS